MPVQFALRPRLRISEGFTPRRRSRLRLPKFALPIAVYWLAAAGITYALVHAHDSPSDSTADRTASDAAQVSATQPDSQPDVASAVPRSTIAAPDRLEPAALEPAAPEPPVALTVPELAPSHAASREAPTDFAPSAEPAPGAAPTTHEAALAEAFPPVRRSDPHSDRAERGAPHTAEPARVADMPLRGPESSDPPSPASEFLSCEAAAASANEELVIGRSDASPDVSREAIAAVLDSGVWIARCDVPFSISIELCVAIKEGKVLGASVVSRPKNPQVELCIKRRAFGLQFPYSRRLDLAKTRF